MPERMDEARSYRPGVREDFDRLYRDSYRRILFTLAGILRDLDAAEECAQEAFVRAYRAWDRWKPEAPAEAWLHRIALNVATSYRRRESAKRMAEALLHPFVQPDARGMEEGTELLDVLRRLPPRDAALLVLRHHHGYSNREVAYALGLPESTVASRAAAAKRRLAAQLSWDEVR